MKLVKILSVFALSSLMLSSCSTSTGATNVTLKKASFYNSDWKLVDEDNSLVKGFNGENVTISINDKELIANGYAGCNQYSTKLNSVEGNNLSFGPIMSTKMACPTSKVENSFLDLLDDVNRYEIKGNEMYFYKNNMLLLKFIN